VSQIPTIDTIKEGSDGVVLPVYYYDFYYTQYTGNQKFGGPQRQRQYAGGADCALKFRRTRRRRSYRDPYYYPQKNPNFRRRSHLTPEYPYPPTPTPEPDSPDEMKDDLKNHYDAQKKPVTATQADLPDPYVYRSVEYNTVTKTDEEADYQEVRVKPGGETPAAEAALAAAAAGRQPWEEPRPSRQIFSDAASSSPPHGGTAQFEVGKDATIAVMEEDRRTKEAHSIGTSGNLHYQLTEIGEARGLADRLDSATRPAAPLFFNAKRLHAAGVSRIDRYIHLDAAAIHTTHRRSADSHVAAAMTEPALHYEDEEENSSARQAAWSPCLATPLAPKDGAAADVGVEAQLPVERVARRDN
jgi:hypothetical protein